MTEPAHILVVDDEASIRRMLEILLVDAGYRVSTAASGEEAMAYVDLISPDLIILDLMLPGISGRDVASRIKSDPRRPFIPIILVTARSDSRTRVSALDAGADDLLAKPVEFAELLARVRALLRLQQAQRSLRAEQRKTELLLHLTRELNTTLDLDDWLTGFLEKLADAMGAVRVSVIVHSSGEWRFYSSSRFERSIDINKIVNSGVAGWVLREHKPLAIADASTDPRWVTANGFHRLIRSVAAAPILREGRALGAITAVHHTPNHFTPEHIDLLATVAQQSAFTLENAALYQLTRTQNALLERRASELQRLNEVGRHLSELMQPDLLMRLLAHLIHYTFGYRQVAILLREDADLVVRALVGEIAPDADLDLRFAANTGITGWVATEREMSRVDDVQADPRYFTPNMNDNVRSELAVPILAGRELYGVLSVSSDIVAAFGPNDEQLLGTLASQLGIALDNARLFEAEKHRVQQLQQVNELSVAITARLDRVQNLRVAADAVVTIFDVKRSAIIAYDPQARTGYVVASAQGQYQLPLAISKILFPDGGFHLIITAPTVVADVATDPRIAQLRPLLLAEQIDAIVIAPLISAGMTIGAVVLDVSGQHGRFGQAELTLLATIASLIGQVVDNARLYREVEDERRTLNAVLDGAADPILLIGPQDRLLLANRAAEQHFGISASGQPLAALIHTGELLQALNGLTNGTGPREITMATGETFSISVAPVTSGENNLLGRVAVLQDITAIKELERGEQERLRAALRRYVSPQVVEQMLAGGSDFGAPVERNVVVLFTDLRGYTALTEGIEARVLVEQVLNRYFTAMTEVLYRYEGTIDKFLGDGLIGVFGTPIAHSDDLHRALCAAVDLQRAFNHLRRTWQAELGLDVGMGIGIGYGPAVVGNIGSTQRTDFTLIGDVVNTTSRLNGVAKAGEIIVSHQLVDALPNGWHTPSRLRDAGKVMLKGKQEPHQIYTIDYEP